MHPLTCCLLYARALACLLQALTIGRHATNEHPASALRSPSQTSGPCAHTQRQGRTPKQCIHTCKHPHTPTDIHKHERTDGGGEGEGGTARERRKGGAYVVWSGAPCSDPSTAMRCFLRLLDSRAALRRLSMRSAGVRRLCAVASTFGGAGRPVRRCSSRVFERRLYALCST